MSSEKKSGGEKRTKKKTGSVSMHIVAREGDVNSPILHEAVLTLTATPTGRIAVTLTGETAELSNVGGLMRAFTDLLEHRKGKLTFTPPTEEQPEKKDPVGGASD